MENWRLVHIKKRYEIGGLTTRETVGFLASLPFRERENWLCWRPGSPGWVKVIECAELTLDPAQKPWWFGEEEAPVESPLKGPDRSQGYVVPPPFAANKVRKEATPEMIETPLPSNIRRIPEQENARKSPRVKLRLKVVVTDGSRTFRAYSVNVSLGGLLLEKKIPWSMSGKTCQVYLSNENSSESISFVARILSSGSDPFRLAFEECDPKYLIILQSWMNTYGDGPNKAAS